MPQATAASLGRRLRAQEPRWIENGLLKWPEWERGQLAAWRGAVCPKCDLGELHKPLEAYAPNRTWATWLHPAHPCGCVLQHQHRLLLVRARLDDNEARKLHQIANAVLSPAEALLYRQYVLLGGQLAAGDKLRVKLSLHQATVAYWSIGSRS